MIIDLYINGNFWKEELIDKMKSSVTINFMYHPMSSFLGICDFKDVNKDIHTITFNHISFSEEESNFPRFECQNRHLKIEKIGLKWDDDLITSRFEILDI